LTTLQIARVEEDKQDKRRNPKTKMMLEESEAKRAVARAQDEIRGSAR
jgi:hypothetical protein